MADLFIQATSITVPTTCPTRHSRGKRKWVALLERCKTDMRQWSSHVGSTGVSLSSFVAVDPAELPPRLFKPVAIPGIGLGLVQDGALAHNNPAKLAEWESRLIWPHHNKVDIVVSLGTGMRDNPLADRTLPLDLFRDSGGPS